MVHDIRGESSSYETFTEEVLAPGQMLYSMPNVRQAYFTVPGMATAVLAVESAMDELAAELGIDPIELRLRNEPGNDESTGLPFSTRRLRECYTAGSREFGWEQRNPRPRSTVDGNWLIGTGMAAAIYGSPRMIAQAHVRVTIGVKGLAELVLVGIAPAVGNAVFHATGRRVRNFPITAEALL